MIEASILVAIVLAVLSLQIGVFCWERRLVWPYGEPGDLPGVPDPTGYGARWTEEAARNGFEFFGWAPDRKGKMYQLSYALMGSPDGDCFCIIGIGTLLGHRLQGTWVHTPARDGRRSYYSTDNPAGMEIDVSGSWKTQLTLTRSLSAMLARHREWITSCAVEPLKFEPGREIEQFRAVRLEHFRWLAELGLIVFCDQREEWWRYTVRGALKLTVLSYSIGLLRAVTFGRFPRTA